MKNKNSWTIINHPLIEHNLTNLRNKDTQRKDFERSIMAISKLLVFPVCQKLKTKEIKTRTPFTKINSLILGENIILIPILRAGLALLGSFNNLIPEAKIGHIGLYRDKNNYQVCEYYFKIPKINDNDQVIVLDPMIATAKTAITAIKGIQKRNSKCQINLVSIISSQYAQEKINEVLQGIKIFVVKIDPKLNKQKYIVPGFGDAGDRFFGTE